MSEMPKVASGLNHVAYLTEDTVATKKFYSDVLGFPLVGAVRNDYDPEADLHRASLHTFFSMGSGEVIAFFEIDGVKHPPKDDVPTWARHFAMGVDSREELDAWHRRLEENDVVVTDVVDHGGIWYSIYFMDPNGVLLEFTYQARDLDADDASAAESMLQEWVARAGSREQGVGS